MNTFAAERSQDVVLVVDGTSDVGRAGSTSLDLSLRGALGVARAYLRPGTGWASCASGNACGGWPRAWATGSSPA